MSHARLFDLTQDAGLNLVGASDDIHQVAWRALLDRGVEPPTHRLARHLRKAEWDGVIYPSFMSRGGKCVALWRWNASGEPTVKVIDPEKRLPSDTQSWDR